MSRGRRLALASLISVAAAVSAAPPSAAASLFDPALRFRVLRSVHFRIHFHQGADRLAARLASIAEGTWESFRRTAGARLPTLTEIVLADQSDLPNGYATPLPYDTVVIFPAAPPGSEFATDDWLRLVFTHEFTHIVHLDRSEGWARLVRNVFGRTAIAFPNMFLPAWQIEGLATYQESASTGEGRLHAGDFRAVVDEAARHGALEPIDRVNGGLTDWPGGVAPYAYGLRFHQYLADRYGAADLTALAGATARRVPYAAAPAFKRIFGQPLGELWRAYEQSLAPPSGPAPPDERMTRLTHHGFVSAGPRFDAAARAIVYARRSPHGFPSLNRIDAGGGDDVELTRRYYGSTTGIGRDALYFDQLEVRRNVALEGDLYEWSRDSGRIRAVTSGARLHDPDLAPDGAALAAVQDRTGRRDLVLVEPLTGVVTTMLSEPGTQFNAPRWSPDGGQVAVERHRPGVDPEIVVVNTSTRATRVVAAARGTRIVMPAWRPDGRAIVAAAAPGDRVFNLFEFPIDGSAAVRQLTATTGGATWPDVSPDGLTLIFVGYTTSGYDLFSMPYPDGAPAALGEAGDAGSTDGVADPGPPGARAYSPLSTLKPTAWSPIVEGDADQVRIGAATAGRDVLGYHAYFASATWLVASPSDAPAPRTAAPDWFASYAYDRWRPTLFATASVETSFFAGPATEQGTPAATARRRRRVEGGVNFPVIRTRISHDGFASVLRSVDDYTRSDGNFTRERTAIRGAWRTTTARTYGYSISPEGGIGAGATAELVRRGLGASDDATIVTGDFRAYLPGAAPHHVVAARLAGGVSRGDPIAGRTFLLGGASADPSVIGFGSAALGLLRGFRASSFAGSHVAVVNLEYRAPIARPQRGVGTWPLFLHTVHAATFVDAGHAWTRAFDRHAVKTAAGAELSANLVLGFHFPLTATAGAAWRHDGSGTVGGGLAAYVRIGRAF